MRSARWTPPATPNAWRIGQLTTAGSIKGSCLPAYCMAVLAVGQYAPRLGADQMRTLTFIAVVFGSQAMIYVIREHGYLQEGTPEHLAESFIIGRRAGRLGAGYCWRRDGAAATPDRGGNAYHRAGRPHHAQLAYSQ